MGMQGASEFVFSGVLGGFNYTPRLPEIQNPALRKQLAMLGIPPSALLGVAFRAPGHGSKLPYRTVL